MTRRAPTGPRRPFRTRWAVTLFVVIGVAVCTAIMLWQLSDDTPDQPDGAPGLHSAG